VPLPSDDPRDDDPDDRMLITQVRSGATEAYGLLYRRHLGPARALARQLTGCHAEAEDLVAEAFAALFATLRRGGGPDVAFRAYLLTVVRHLRYDRARESRRVELCDDLTRHDPGVPWEDPALGELESMLAGRAYARLHERWRTVLWHTEVRRQSPAEVAPVLGLTPNGVSALAYRAREGLRQAYLQEHLRRPAPAGGTAGDGGTDGDGHEETVDRLGAWVRGGLTAGHRGRVDSHLAACPACRELAAELTDLGGALCRESARPARTG
jgi:RNA polymerase sigma factor (sigma-70 family)